MKHGFTLIEVLIATAIASILTVALFFSFNQINDSVRKTSDTVDVIDAALLVDHILFKDISGSFIPVQAIPPKEKKKQPNEGKKPEAKPADKDKTDATKKPPQPEKKEEKKDEEKSDDEKSDEKSKVPLLKDPFMSKNNAEQMSLLTCITANPMRVYWGEKTGDPKPSCVRVVYSLEEKKDRGKKQPRYQLFRQEGTKLELGLYTKKESEIERYMIADNIVSCKLKFVVADEKKEEQEEGASIKKVQDKEPAKKNEKPEKEIKEFNEWEIGKDKKDVRARLMLPDTVIMTLVLSNQADTRERSFSFRIPVAARFHEVPVQEEPKSAVPQPSAAKPDAGKSGEQDKNKKEFLADSANKIMQSLYTQFGRA
jgi:prepilin-type N-terminal cleavage/methylation domain-containing protein